MEEENASYHSVSLVRSASLVHTYSTCLASLAIIVMKILKVPWYAKVKWDLINISWYNIIWILVIRSPLELNLWNIINILFSLQHNDLIVELIGGLTINHYYRQWPNYSLLWGDEIGSMSLCPTLKIIANSYLQTPTWRQIYWPILILGFKRHIGVLTALLNSWHLKKKKKPIWLRRLNKFQPDSSSTM